MNNDGDWIREVQIEDLPKAFRELAVLAGMAAVEFLYPSERPAEAQSLEKEMGAFISVKLSTILGGGGNYYPKLDSCLRELKYRKLRAEARTLTGSDKYRVLARKYNYTEVWVRELVDHQEEGDQMEMFAANE